MENSLFNNSKMQSKLETYFNVPFGKDKTFSITGKPVELNSGDGKSTAMTMAYDPSGNHIAVGCFDGSIKTFSPFTGKQQAVFASPMISDANAKESTITSIKWKPTQDVHKASQYFMSTNSDGIIQYWNFKTNELISEDNWHQK